MHRRTGFGLTMVLLGLWIVQTGLGEPGGLSAVVAVAGAALASFGLAVAAGVVEPERIPDEELDPLAARFVAVVLLVGAASVAGLVVLSL